ncbi:uracil-DNA glycosylase family protein [Kribbella sp. NPDC023855]|uniref:uracil-DNA glycosylase family protein n=1 Tax=Kribbella sp. NPDC023855 TaxID=3154698 RepID=UPI0033F7812A
MLDFDPGAPPSIEFDKGPPTAIARHFAALPPIAPEDRDLFWYDWGPVFYRGRLNGAAKVLGIASDPGPTERLVGRTLVGDAGQRVQGFLTKLGLTTNYALVNAFPLAVHPSKSNSARPLLSDPAQLAWRNRFYDLITDSRLEAIIAFGGNAQAALKLWDTAPDVPIFRIPHPSAHDAADLAARWAAAIPAARAAVTPDPGGDQTGPNYGVKLTESDYARIPHADLPYGQPIWIGDDRWGRTGSPRHNNTIERSGADLDHTMIWQAPRS